MKILIIFDFFDMRNSASLCSLPIAQSNIPLVQRARQTAVVKAVAKGFTLIEIMVVIAILGIMAAVVVPKLVGHTDTAKISAAKQDIANLKQALILYKLDNHNYPTTEQGLQALVTKPQSGPPANGWKSDGYLEKLPKDPWQNPYQYLNPGIKGEFDIFSYGADGQPGGEGINADIGSWDL
jgi:general secretion pathway protein G